MISDVPRHGSPTPRLLFEWPKRTSHASSTKKTGRLVHEVLIYTSMTTNCVAVTTRETHVTSAIVIMPSSVCQGHYKSHPHVPSSALPGSTASRTTTCPGSSSTALAAACESITVSCIIQEKNISQYISLTRGQIPCQIFHFNKSRTTGGHGSWQ
jgi:hypothetical protein